MPLLTLGPKTRLAVSLRHRVNELEQLVEWLRVDARLAVELGEAQTYADILLAAVKVRDAAVALRTLQAWRDAEEDWQPDDRVTLTEDFAS